MLQGPFFITLGDQPQVARNAERGKAWLRGGPYATLDQAVREAASLSRASTRWMDEDACDVFVRTNDSKIVQRVHFRDHPEPSYPQTTSIGAFGRKQSGGY